MINSLTIRNFKSIKDLTIDCKRINLFIGEPNTGKSNILEALGLLSWIDYAKVAPEQKKSQDSSKLIVRPQQYYPRLFDFIRFLSVQDLFRDGLIYEKAEILINKENRKGIELKAIPGSFVIEKKGEKTGKKSNKNQKIIRLDFNGDVIETTTAIKDFSSIKFYRFLKQPFYFPFNTSPSLLPPSGLNLFSVVMGNERLREIMTNFYKESGLRLVLKPQSMAFEIQSQREDFTFSYPYISVSDTLQRIIFHIIAMESNKNSTLVFEEPESYAFPYFTKYLGERIARYNTNQFFISTHNPYLLEPILEKADKKTINVFVVFIEDFQTKVVRLTSDQISEILDSDPFFNLDKFIVRGDE
jgi:AAA15 family ATPase/GTPase